LKVCEEGISEDRYQFVKVWIEELRIFLEGLELRMDFSKDPR
jgi:hypothetical protein